MPGQEGLYACLLPACPDVHLLVHLNVNVPAPPPALLDESDMPQSQAQGEPQDGPPSNAGP